MMMEVTQNHIPELGAIAILTRVLEDQGGTRQQGGVLMVGLQLQVLVGTAVQVTLGTNSREKSNELRYGPAGSATGCPRGREVLHSVQQLD